MDVTPLTRTRRPWLLLTVGLLAVACVKRLDRTLVLPGTGRTLDGKSAYLKAHLRSGYLYVLSEWHADSGSAEIRGTGILLDQNRSQVAQGKFRLPRDSVALFETNVVKPSGATAALTVMVGVTAVVAGICASSPKTCFGSCPTFYAPDSTGEALQAEAFSASIAPGLQATDVDMLYRTRPRSRELTLRLTNEALETHVIRFADLLAAPRPPGGRVFVTADGLFRAATDLTPPSRCTAAEEDCRAALLAFDGRERSSRADSVDLATRETIDLEFAPLPAGAPGLVITARQSLMTTYLIYQALAYMGSEAGRWLAAAQPGRGQGELGRLLGQIDVLIPDSGTGWTLVGSVGEVGPLAPDTKVLPLPPGATNQSRRVRLRLTRGLWRLDYVALATLGDTIRPLRIPPHTVWRDGFADRDAWRALTESVRPLVTLPGDAYDLAYRLPMDFARYELFLTARGYYLEWMRREWLAEENRLLAARVLLDPAGTLRALAPAYQRQEPEIERLFWNSRYVRH